MQWHASKPRVLMWGEGGGDPGIAVEEALYPFAPAKLRSIANAIGVKATKQMPKQKVLERIVDQIELLAAKCVAHETVADDRPMAMLDIVEVGGGAETV